jgi:tetratricopeptide (TPR) repeat protein
MLKSREGDSFFASGEIDKALNSWKQSIGIRKTSQVYGKMTMAYMLKNDLTEAGKWAEEGLSFFPGDTNLAFNITLVNYQAKNYSAAMKDIDRLLALDTNYPNAHYLKGLLLEETGKKEEAKKEYVKEININPGSARTWQKIREEVKNEK